jgi:hypothetical protein
MLDLMNAVFAALSSRCLSKKPFEQQVGQWFLCVALLCVYSSFSWS